MKKFIILPILCSCLFTFGQFFKRDSLTSKIDAGFYANLLYYDQLIDYDADKFVHLFSCTPQPYVFYNLYNNIYVGGSFGYEFYFSDFYEKKNFVEAGAAMRYVIPYTIDKKLIKRIHLYFELAYYKTNYRMVDEIVNTFTYQSITIDENFITSPRLDQSKVSIPIGVTIHLTNRLYIDLNWQYNKYIKGTSETGFMGGIGYNFMKTSK